MMRLFRFFAVLIFAVSLFAGCANTRQAQQSTYQQYSDQDVGVRVERMPLQEEGPATSSPQVQMAPNGDRYSPYPPYFHPEHSGSTR